MSTQVRTEPLTQREREILEQEIKNARIIAYVISGIFCIPVGIAMYIGFDEDAIPAYMFAFILGIATVFIWIQYNKGRQDIARGEKRVTTGIITEKRHETRTSSSGSGSSRSTKTTHYYYVFIGEKKWDVGSSRFHSLREGQKIAVKETPTLEHILDVEILEDPHAAGAFRMASDTSANVLDAQMDQFLANPSAIPAQQRQAPAERQAPAFSPPLTQRLSELDIALVKAKRNAHITRSTIWTVVGTFLTYFACNIALFILILIIDPLRGNNLTVVAYLVSGFFVAHRLRKQIKTFTSYKQAFEDDLVVLKPLVISDKIVHARNGSRYHSLILTDGVNLSVNEGAYALARTGDTVYLRQIPSLNNLNIGIEIKEGVCFPM